MKRRTEKHARQRRARIPGGLVTCGLGLTNLVGCTGESTRLAIETQQRADQIQQALFDRQHEGLARLLYRDLLAHLERPTPDEPPTELSEAQRRVLSDAWNERDLLEFWCVQNERARALRLIGVDAKLYGSQSVIDLLIKAIEARVQRAREGLASASGARLGSDAGPSEGGAPASQPAIDPAQSGAAK